MSFEINKLFFKRLRVDLQSRPNTQFAPGIQIIGDYHRSNPFNRKEPFKPPQHCPY